MPKKEQEEKRDFENGYGLRKYDKRGKGEWSRDQVIKLLMLLAAIMASWFQLSNSVNDIRGEVSRHLNNTSLHMSYADKVSFFKSLLGPVKEELEHIEKELKTLTGYQIQDKVKRSQIEKSIFTLSGEIDKIDRRLRRENARY